MGAALMPLDPGAIQAIQAILRNLEMLQKGQKPPFILIGRFTDRQLADIDAVRRGLRLHEIALNEIIFVGRHLHNSRSKDGYTLRDMALQIESALSSDSVVFANARMTALDSASLRQDGYGNQVRDRAIFECTQKRPRAELFSVIPKGDQAPANKKGSPRSEPFRRDDPG